MIFEHGFYSVQIFGGKGQGIHHPFDSPARNFSPVRASLSSKEEPCPLSPHRGFFIPCPFPYKNFDIKYPRIKFVVQKAKSSKSLQPYPNIILLFGKILKENRKTYNFNVRREKYE
ncbi:MAG: hypothetical protein ACOC5S_04895 [Acidobacteriota bacterium]